MVSFKVGIDGNTSRCLRHQEHTRHYGMVATFERHLYRLGQGESRTLIVVNANLHGYSRILAVHKHIVASDSESFLNVDSNITPVEESTGLSVFIL